MNEKFDYLVLIGRFQPFHNGHFSLLRRALNQAGKVIVILGSSLKHRSIKNPFSDAERQQMISASIAAEDKEAANRVKFCMVRDFYNDTKWIAAIQEAVQKSIDKPNARVGIIGNCKDESSYYLKVFPQWELIEGPTVVLNATDIRHLMFEQENESGNWMLIETTVPASVYAFIKAFKQMPMFKDLLKEHDYIKKYKATWEKAPYPPTFVTVDVVAYCKGHVLMVKRGDYPNKGLWALPGGFVNQHERLMNAALRELKEETGMELLDGYLRSFAKDNEVFDHPDRSLRGRTITHAYFFELMLGELPTVKGGDDAAQAKWIPVGELKEMEPMIFEDHLEIVNRFLNIL